MPGGPGGHGFIPPGFFLLQLSQRADHMIHHAVGDRLLGAHPVIPVGIDRDLLERLAGFLGDQGGSGARASSRFPAPRSRYRRPGRARRPSADAAGSGVCGRQNRRSFLPARKISAPALATQPVPIMRTGGFGIHEPDHVMDGVAAFDVTAGRIHIDVDRLGRGAGEGQQAAGDVAGDLVVDGAEISTLRCLSRRDSSSLTRPDKVRLPSGSLMSGPTGSGMSGSVSGSSSSRRREG